MPRLFTGLELPSDIITRLSSLRGGLSGARWIDPENYHLTLRFIGDVDERTANEVMAALETIDRPAFDVTLAGLDSFGGRKPRAVFARAEASADLIGLQSDQERAIQRAGLPPEPRKFTPHVTLARLRGISAGAVANFLSIRGVLAPMTFPVNRFVLYSSRASTGGGPYIVEAAYSLN